MNYPIWEVLDIGGGSLIAIISVLHAYIAHLAVGGGLFLWLTDWKGVRENDSGIIEYVKKHTWFFLLLTMVFGGVTGVGIWFIIALVNPAGTSALIHTFVFGWAIEWVFFIGEIVALLLYYYKFDTMPTKSRLTIAFFYFLFAWLSLVIINGILSFMLTPGVWLESGGFWDGFFNPTYFPSVIFRSAVSFMIAGLFGYITVLRLKNEELREKLMRWCSMWMLVPFAVMALSGIWYYFAIPAEVRETAFVLNNQSFPFIVHFIIGSILLFLFAVYFTQRASIGMQRSAIVLLVIIGLGWFGSFEYMREIARKPFVIHEYMYSNSILKSNREKLNEEGILTHAKWTSVKEVTNDNILEAGREIFNIECLACHTVDGFRNDIVPQTADLTYMGLMAQLSGQGLHLNYMPPFIGTTKEKEALAAYIISVLHGKDVVGIIPAHDPSPVESEIPPFDPAADEYVLLAWNDLGMHCISDSDPWFVILPPANTLEAQLIKRGPLPELVSEGIEIKYYAPDGFENPAAEVRFWEFAPQNFGADIPENTGVFGAGMNGTMHYNKERKSFIVEAIPVVPYKSDGTYFPYPQFTVEAVDIATGEVLAVTKVVAPTSTEMGCRNCHGGGWRVDDVSGVGDTTAINILKVHDRLSGTKLYNDALNGSPVLCQSCHPDPALGAEGKPGHNNLSTALHGWHAAYMHVDGSKACVMCHPASPVGNTRCNRGIHPQLGLDCTNCHGELVDHALGLLLNQQQNQSALRMIKNLQPTLVDSVSEIHPRKPWLQEPDCLTCHENFQQPDGIPSAFNVWNSCFNDLFRIRTDNAGVRCEACHNSPHSEYPVNNEYGNTLDNAQPLQYMGTFLPIGSEGNCAVCHTINMDMSFHHKNMLRPFRNSDMVEIKLSSHTEEL